MELSKEYSVMLRLCSRCGKVETRINAVSFLLVFMLCSQCF